MGRATRWLRSLFGGRKERKDACTNDRREKRRWSFKSGRDSFDTPPWIPPAMPAEMPWLRSKYFEAEKEQSKHAIAVAAATAAAADAAVAAAEAAVAVVRLTRQDVGITFRGLDVRLTAAVKIQTLFRGYLAKKALRALKALVKLQALVRGFLIRKQAAATLHSMEALIRAQATVRAQKSKSFISLKSPQETYGDENRTEQTPSFHSSNIDWSPKIVEIDTGRPSLPGRLSKPECRCSVTANSTPRFLNLTGRNFTPPSPSPNYPNYMSNTRAFEAKVRWQSAPKQRPEQSSSRKRVPLGEVAVVEQSRASLSCIGIQRSHSHQEDDNFSFRSEGTGKRLDRSLEFYLQRKW